MVSFRLKGVLIRWILLLAVMLLLVLGVRRCLGGESFVSAQPYKTQSQPDQALLPQEYVMAYGWEILQTDMQVYEVVIPQEFDELFATYNRIQKQQGMDLEKYKGQRVKRYTYPVCNYPGYPEDVVANVLVKDQKVIGGDICLMRPDGFVHGFRLPAEHRDL